LIVSNKVGFILETVFSNTGAQQILWMTLPTPVENNYIEETNKLKQLLH